MTNNALSLSPMKNRMICCNDEKNLTSKMTSKYEKPMFLIESRTVNKMKIQQDTSGKDGPIMYLGTLIIALLAREKILFRSMVPITSSATS